MATYIRVLGQGLIPRNKGIAPHMDPFPVDEKTLLAILGQGGLIPQVYDPQLKTFITITIANEKEMWAKYGPQRKVTSAAGTPVIKKTVTEVSEAEKIAYYKSVGYTDEQIDALKKSWASPKSEPKKPVEEKPAEQPTPAEEKVETKAEEKTEEVQKSSKKSTIKPVGNPDKK